MISVTAHAGKAILLRDALEPTARATSKHGDEVVHEGIRAGGVSAERVVDGTIIGSRRGLSVYRNCKPKLDHESEDAFSPRCTKETQEFNA